MAPLKRKTLHGDVEAQAAAAETTTTRRVTRQTSIPPPPLPVPPAKSESQRRSLRGTNTHSTHPMPDNDEGSVATRLRTREHASGSTDTTAASRAVTAQAGGTHMPATKRAAKAAVGTSNTQETQAVHEVSGQSPTAAAATKRTTRHSARTSDTTATAASPLSPPRHNSKGAPLGKPDKEEEDKENDDPGTAQAEGSLPATRRSRKTTTVSATPVSPPPAPAAGEGNEPTSPGATEQQADTAKDTAVGSAGEADGQGIPSTAGAAPLKKITEIRPPPTPPMNRAVQPPGHASQSLQKQLQEQRQQQQSQQRQHLPPPQPQAQLHTTTASLRKLSPATGPDKPVPLTSRPASTTLSATLAPAPAISQPTSGARAQPPVPAVSSLVPMSAAPPPSPGRPDRNIDMVVLGKICFRAWYPSYYGKEVLGDASANTHHGRANHSSKDHHNQSYNGHDGNGVTAAPVSSSSRQYRHDNPILDRLYVCPFCFKYSKEIVPWWGHVQVCEHQFQIPGEKIYVHPRSVRSIRVPAAAAIRGGSKRRKGAGGDADVQYVERQVRDEGEWSVWEVDGEKDVLFCQNISLFAKLFLDNKSVFFDVTGFHYFLLVYTPPMSPPGAPVPGVDGTGSFQRPRVVGFFSKEKMSWDNNNLACILVFPPWQRKGLGSLLMGVSYEISRREGVLGGPEKPISDLGKKGYKRFWAGEIARWLLSIDVSTTPRRIVGGTADSGATDTTDANGALQVRGRGGVAETDDRGEIVIDVADMSQATWILREDCLLVLRDMGLVEDAGMGMPKQYCENVLPTTRDARDDGRAGGDGAEEAGAVCSSAGAVAGLVGATAPGSSASGTSSVAAGAVAGSQPVPSLGSSNTGGAAAAAAGGALPEKQLQHEAPKEVQRVRLSKTAVQRWVTDHGISLQKACDPSGFLKVYTSKSQQAAEDS